METFKQSRSDLQKQVEEKVPAIGLDVMIPIFWRLSTSELVKFISNVSNHPLGKFWSGALKFVVEKRLPFSLKAGIAVGKHQITFSSPVLYDCNGSKVADINDIKHPEHFHLSPFCELIEEVELPIRFPALWQTAFMPLWQTVRFLSNLNTLTLAFWDAKETTLEESEIDLLKAVPSELMSQLSSLSLTGDFSSDPRNAAFYNEFPHVIARAQNLRKLRVEERQFAALLQGDGQAADAVTAQLGVLLSNLGSLCIGGSGKWRERILEFISRRCTNLNELRVPLRNEVLRGEIHGHVQRRGVVRDHFAAIRQLPSVTKLGLDASGARQETLVVDGEDAAVTSVTEFCLGYPNFVNEPTLFAMLSKLPNVASFEIQACKSGTMLQFASSLCSNRIFRHLQTLTFTRNIGPLRYDALLQFIDDSNINLPDTVDLSQAHILRVPSGREFLVDLFHAMEANTIRTLQLQAIVLREAIDRLREYISSANRKCRRPGHGLGKVLAWKNEEVSAETFNDDPLGQWHVSELTDFKIEGVKTSGSAKGSAFKVRIFRQ